MATHVIAPAEWGAFLDHFSRRLQGTQVELDLIGPENGVQAETRWLPFLGIMLDTKGSGAGTIAVVTGDDPASHITHTIFAPQKILHKNTTGELMNHEVDDGETLEITCHGTPPIVLLRFRAPE